MEDKLDSRVARLEFRADAQDGEIRTLKDTQATFGRSLEAIERILTRIQYGLYGAGAVVAVNAMGLKETIAKLVLH
ncbi:hypothetical protein ACPUER_11840 [Burkholderia sp. DN3021]|uniref:hypothetical protein n=1 Tax=Burkholderia sp. DN3021 TaxID=3410137 RepID=UPI003C7A9409